MGNCSSQLRFDVVMRMYQCSVSIHGFCSDVRDSIRLAFRRCLRIEPEVPPEDAQLERVHVNVIQLHEQMGIPVKDTPEQE